MMVEHDEASEEKELKAKIVFAMQGLGGARTVVRNSQTL